MIFRNLSFRYKIPIRGTILILITSFTVTASLVFRSYDDMKQDLLSNAEGVGQVMAHTLVPAFLKDDVWQAFKLIRTPINTNLNNQHSFQANLIIVLNNNFNVYVASDPFRFPVLTPLENAGGVYKRLQQFLLSHHSNNSEVLDLPDTDSLYVASPIISDNVRLGTLILSYPRARFTPRFLRFANRALLATIIPLCILVPLSWYWGILMANPLIRLAGCMSRIGQEEPTKLDCELYDSKDEIGQLGDCFKQMVGELQSKHDLEKQVVVADRLAAIGRLSASIAHEINNPLGGMLNAINTYRHYGQLDEMSEKTISLLERGLLQIGETVSALLIEAKPTSRHFRLEDADDIRTLIMPDVQKQNITLEWAVDIDTFPLSSTLIRQIMINLLLNSIKAVTNGGIVGCHIMVTQDNFILCVYNNGEPIPEDQMPHLFEPFVYFRPDGNGLGLWVCYQIITQLGGSIVANSNKNETRFTATIPLIK